MTIQEISKQYSAYNRSVIEKMQRLKLYYHLPAFVAPGGFVVFEWMNKAAEESYNNLSVLIGQSVQKEKAEIEEYLKLKKKESEIMEEIERQKLKRWDWWRNEND